jgi:hypothetical protein
MTVLLSFQMFFMAMRDNPIVHHKINECINYFSHNCDKIPDKNQCTLKEEEVISAHSLKDYSPLW